MNYRISDCKVNLLLPERFCHLKKLKQNLKQKIMDSTFTDSNLTEFRKISYEGE